MIKRFFMFINEDIRHICVDDITKKNGCKILERPARNGASFNRERFRLERDYGEPAEEWKR